MLVDRLLSLAAERTPEAEALVCAGQRLSYGELDAAAMRVAGGLRALGVHRGDRVAIYLENSIEAVASIFGAMRAGASFVPINPTTKCDKLEFILRDSGASALIAERRARETVDQARARSGRDTAVVYVGTGADGDDARAGAGVSFRELDGPAPGPFARTDLDLAAVIYTSGSTGRPKGVMMAHANVVAATTSINGYLQNSPDDTILDVLPLSFDYGLYQLFLSAQAGARVVLERSMVFPAVTLEVMARERVTGLPLVPMIAALLLRQGEDAIELPALRYITNTGAVLPPVHIAALRQRLPHVRVFSMYGLTECKRVSYLPPEDVDARPTSVGRAMDNVEVYLIDDDGQPMSSGVGQLVVRGANVMQGYWNAEDETARVLRPGRLPNERVLHTGDIFRIDEDGYMYFVSRTDDVIKSRGQKVSPREIENVLHGAPGVCEAAVVGVRDVLLGEALKAYVTLHPGTATTERDILFHCSKYLEDFMVPGSVEIVDALPHTTSGKLARRELADASA